MNTLENYLMDTDKYSEYSPFQVLNLKQKDYLMTYVNIKKILIKIS